MKSVVVVSAGEVIRMVAHVVLGRIENHGRAVGAVEVHTDSAGLTELRVLIFDTPGEAMEHGQAVQAATQPKGATVLSLVHPAVPAAAEAAPQAEMLKPGDDVRLKSGGPVMHVRMSDHVTGELWCEWPDPPNPNRLAPFAVATLERAIASDPP